MIKWDEQWAEAFAITFIIIGFITSILIKSPTLSYISVFLAGLVAGRIYYLKHQTEPILPFILIIIGFLLGYIIGNIWTSRLWTLVFFALGFGISYYLHLKEIVGIFKSENFVK